MNNKTRARRNVEITDNDLLSAGYYVGGLRGMGSSFFRVMSRVATTQTIIQIWRAGRGFCRFKVSKQTWPGNPENIDTGSLKDYEDLQALTALYQEDVMKSENST